MPSGARASLLYVGRSCFKGEIYGGASLFGLALRSSNEPGIFSYPSGKVLSMPTFLPDPTLPPPTKPHIQFTGVCMYCMRLESRNPLYRKDPLYQR